MSSITKGKQIADCFKLTDHDRDALAQAIDAALKYARIEGFDQGVAWEQHESHDRKWGKL